MVKYFSLLLLMVISECSAAKVGLLIMATGRYDHFVAPLIDSADTYFVPGHDVTYFVFTDGTIPERDDIVRIEQKRLGWPHDTLMRLPLYYRHRDKWADMDYVYSCDADMLFVDVVGDEIFSERVATQHPGYINKRGTYEARQVSTAYVAPDEGEIYFAGGFNGGSKKGFEHFSRTVTQQIIKDLEHNFIAVWHDESHINRYFIDYPPSVVLSPSYCYPESWDLPYTKRLLALDKNHEEMRK